LDQIHAFLKAG